MQGMDRLYVRRLKWNPLLFRISILFIAWMTMSGTKGMPGRLLLIGGGSERTGANAWSTLPYRWAVETSANHRVAIISYQPFSDDLKNYFLDECNAVSVGKFEITSRTMADASVTYDSLMQYDVFFFRGGDQLQYYNLYKGTLTEKAVTDKFRNGGVICGTSAGMALLGEIDFIAENGTAYPEEALQNPFNTDITLARDFLNLMPGYLLDTHFSQRGRFGRLIGFLANRYLLYDEKPLAIGMDDLTALAIDTNEVGRVFGTGAAHLYRLPDKTPFVYEGTLLNSGNIEISQLLHGSTVNFRTGSIQGAGNDIIPGSASEMCPVTILASGSDELHQNQGMLNFLVNQTGSKEDSILILHGADADPTELIQQLQELGASYVLTGAANYFNSYNKELAQNMLLCRKLLFINNKDKDLTEFIAFGLTGKEFQHKITDDKAVMAFVGNDARYAGAVVVENHLLPEASYEGKMIFHDGPGLLRNTVIMPGTFLSDDIYENTATAIPYMMVQERLRYGAWMHGNSFIQISHTGQGSVLVPHGSFPVMLLTHRGSKGGISSRTATGDTLIAPRMVAGFEHAILNLLPMDVPYLLSDQQTSVTGPQNTVDKELIIYPNPVKELLHISYPGAFNVDVLNAQGNNVVYSCNNHNRAVIRMQKMPPGFYFIRIVAGDNLEGICRIILKEE
jgi:cyanophycinase